MTHQRSALRLPKILAVVLSFGACAPILHVHTKAAQNVSFQAYRTFAIGSAEEAPPGYQRPSVTPAVLAVVDAAVRDSLAPLGYQAAALPDADLIVRVGAGVRIKRHAPAADQEDALGNQVGVDDLDGSFNYTEETLTIDVFDAKTKRRVWHGASREIIKPGQVNHALVDRATRGILARFPKNPAASAAAPQST